MQEYNDNQPWKSIKEQISTVIFDEGVTSVGKNAFKGYTTINSVTWGSSLQIIDESAFEVCIGIPSINLPNIQTIKSNAFNGCINVESITLPKVQTIETNSFKNCDKVTELTLPSSTTSIGADAFSEIASLKTVNYEGISNPCQNGIKAFNSIGTTIVNVDITYEPTDFCGLQPITEKSCALNG